MNAVTASPPAPRRSPAAVERRRQRALAALAIPALALLAVLFAYPVLRLMALSVEGGSLAWYAKALGESLYLEVFWITIRIAIIVTLATLVLSYPVAYFLATTSRLGAALGFALVILPLWTSILVRTYAWMVLLGRNGVVNKSLIAVGAIDEPLALLHNELGVVIGMVHVLMPYMVLPVYAAMRRVDPDLLQAAEGLDRAAGARRAQLVVRERACQRAAGRHDCDLWARAARDRRARRRSGMSTRAARSPRRRARLRRLALGLVCAPIFLFLMLPLVVVFPLSLSSAPYLQFPPPGLSLRWYQSYFGDPVWIDATVRSLVIGATTTLASLAVGMPLAFSLVRGRYWGRKLLDRLAVAPMIVPTIIISVAIYGLFAKFKLIGAWYGIALAHTILALPFVIIVLGASLRGLDESLEQAALGLGASRWQAIRRVTLPEIRPSIVTAAVLAFITSFDELVVAMFLAGPQMTLPKKMFDNIRMEIDPTIAAVSVLQILIITAALLIAQRFGRGATAVGVSG